MHISQKIAVFGLVGAITLGIVWYSGIGGDMEGGLGSSVLAQGGVDSMSCTDVPGKIQDVAAEKGLINAQVETLQKDIQSLSDARSKLDVSQKQIEEEKTRLNTFEHNFFKETKFTNADELRTYVQKITLDLDNTRQKLAKSTNFIRNRILNRKIRILERLQKKNSALLTEYTNALNVENERIKNKEDGQKEERVSLVQQIAQKESSKQNYATTLRQLETLNTQLVAKKTTCLETAQEAARQESAKREQNAVSTVAVDTNANTNTNTNADTSAGTNAGTDNSTTTNTVTTTNTTQTNTTQTDTAQERARASAGSEETVSTSVVTATNTPAVSETVTTNTGTQSSAVVTQAETVTPVTTQTAPVVTTSSPVEETPTAPVTQQTSSVVQEVNNQGAASTQSVTAQTSTTYTTTGNTGTDPAETQATSTANNTANNTAKTTQNTFVDFSGLPPITPYFEQRNRDVVKLDPSLINVEGGQVCWFSWQSTNTWNKLPINESWSWLEKSRKIYDFMYLDEFRIYIGQTPTSNQDSPNCIAAYIGNGLWAGDQRISSPSYKKDELSKWLPLGTEFSCPAPVKTPYYFAFHANTPGLRHIRVKGDEFDQKYAETGNSAGYLKFHGCVGKNDPLPKF